MLRAKAFAKESAGNRLCVVEKFMLPQCIVQCFVFVLCMLLGRQFASRASRRVRQSARRKRACVRRDTPTYRCCHGCCSPERLSKEPLRRVETLELYNIVEK